MLRTNSAESSRLRPENTRCSSLPDCVKHVYGSTDLTTNGIASLKFEHLTVRPELRRRTFVVHSLVAGTIMVGADALRSLLLNCMLRHLLLQSQREALFLDEHLSAIFAPGEFANESD